MWCMHPHVTRSEVEWSVECCVPSAFSHSLAFMQLFSCLAVGSLNLCMSTLESNWPPRRQTYTECICWRAASKKGYSGRFWFEPVSDHLQPEFPVIVESCALHGSLNVVCLFYLMPHASWLISDWDAASSSIFSSSGSRWCSVEL